MYKITYDGLPVSAVAGASPDGDAGSSRVLPWSANHRALPRQQDKRSSVVPLFKTDGHSPGPRIVLYSHDTMGLGHVRRNLTIAQTLAGPTLRARVLLITGASTVGGLALPKGVDCVTLPAIHKLSNEQYRPRSLELPMGELTSIRSNIIRGALEAFVPEFFIVDNVPRGVNGELDDSLQYLRSRGSTTCVLGLRDVIDSPDAVAAEWGRRGNEACVQQYYDAVWVYGDPRVYDQVKEYGFAKQTASKLRYTGYLERQPDSPPATGCRQGIAGMNLPLGETLLCMAGGGQDGAMLAQTVCEAALPGGINTVVLTGPFMPPNIRNQLLDYAAGRPRLRVLEYHPEPMRLLMQADYVVSMGGYNSLSEILSLRKNALIVPRTAPRREQLIRAERLASLGLVDFLPTADLTPEAIGRWVSKQAASPPRAQEIVDFGGLLRIQQFMVELIEARRQGTVGSLQKAIVE
ncbi:MAG: glycosyltransferase [Betaproteobacteria bacterium]|nr:MAG: glycosyltransferase [Betaproteobacteria bacterium]